MDFLRSGYRTSIYSIDPSTGSIIPVPIRWYRAPPGALPHPYHHQYASANWTFPTNYGEPVGEILDFGRPWNNGAVAGTKGDNCCADASKWIGPLERLTTPIPLWPYGQPKCCHKVPYWVGEGPLTLQGGAAALFVLGDQGEGALDLEGSASAELLHVWDAEGALDLEGSASAELFHFWDAEGALALEGSAPAAFGYEYTPDGPLRIRVAATWAFAFTPAPDGHLSLEGSATYSQGSLPYGGCSTYPSGAGPKFQIVAAGFTGSCSVFNQTWILPTPASGCTWTETISGNTCTLTIFGVGSAQIQFLGSGAGAQYATSSAFSPLGSTTMPLQFSGCGGGSAPSFMTCTAVS